MKKLAKLLILLWLFNASSIGFADTYVPGSGNSGYSNQNNARNNQQKSSSSSYNNRQSNSPAAYNNQSNNSASNLNQRQNTSSAFHSTQQSNASAYYNNSRQSKARAAKADFDSDYYKNYNRHSREHFGLPVPDPQHRVKRQINALNNYRPHKKNTYFGDRIDPRLNHELLHNAIKYFPVGKNDHFPPAATVSRNFKPVHEIVNQTKVEDRRQPGYAFNKGYTRDADRQPRLREMANDQKLGNADRGWIHQEINRVELTDPRNAHLSLAERKKALNGKTYVRNPPGKQLAHGRGQEHHKGYGYEYANMQDTDLHMLQHKYDNFGAANPERVPAGYKSAIQSNGTQSNGIQNSSIPINPSPTVKP